MTGWRPSPTSPSTTAPTARSTSAACDTPTNAEFTRALAAAVHRPAFAAVPSPLLRLGAGEMAPELLGSVNAVPAALKADGYRFRDPDVAAVLATGLR